MDETVSSDEETVIVDPKDVQFDFVKCDGKEDLPFPGPLYTHGVYKYHKNWDNLSKKSGTGNLARYECAEHRRSGCPGKAGVQFLRREDADGNIEMYYELYFVSSHEEHTCVPDEGMIIADRVRENMKREVRRNPWIPVSQVYNRLMNEQVYSLYSEDIVARVDAKMGRRPEGFLHLLQQKLTGGRPLDRDAWDPAAALKIVTGGEKVLTLDSHQMEPGWQNKDLMEKVRKIRKPRGDNDRLDTDTGSEGSGASSQVMFCLNIFSEQSFANCKVLISHKKLAGWFGGHGRAA